ncbi:MAG TPA: hypothetical protein VN924_27975 [Bryobacteraceae bacterium]|nr:hypothetical protein [Bryobacteraceae bacterium]
MAQIAVLQIKVLEGEGIVHPPGTRIAHSLTVEVTDETGRPVAGAAVSFQLPPEGPSGLFSNGLRTDLVLTDAAGHASLHSVQLNRTSGQFRIRITAVKEQARAGAISTQYIADMHNVAPVAAAKAGPAATAQPTDRTPQPAKSGEITQTAQTTAKSGEITPTTSKMGSGSHKKWIILATIAAVGAGVAFLGVSRASSSSTKAAVPASTVSLGTPGITIGNP